MSNQVQVLIPYRFAGGWAFDDARHGLVREPFVMGVPAMIDHVLASLDLSHLQRIRLLVSSSKFPEAHAELQWLQASPDKNWNEFEMLGTSLRGWLCPALYYYFKPAPKTLYVRIEELTHAG